MAIKGSLVEASLPSVIQLLTYSLKSGCLSVTDGQNFGNIFLKDGQIIHATILNRKVRLTETMIERKLFDKHVLDEALGMQKQKKKRIGEILIDMGVISRAVLEEELKQQIEETIFTMLTWETGYFNFEADLLPGPEEYTIKLSAHELLLQGARRIDEWQKVESKLPSYKTVLARKENDQDLHLNELEEKVLSLIDGNTSIDDVIKSSGLDFFEASKAIYVLLAAGVVEKPKRPPERKPVTGDTSEHGNIGFALYKTAKYDEAEREFKKVIDGDSESVEALFFLGLIEMMRFHDEKAKEYFEDALSKERRSSVLINIGYLCSRMGLYEDALAYLKEARELEPGNLKMLLNLGIVYYRKGDLEEAAKVFDECLEHSDETVMPYLYMSTISALKDDTGKAIDWLKRAINKFPRLTAFKNNLALLYESLGQYDDAEKLYRQVVFAQPEQSISIRNLANLYYRLGFYGAARKYYEELPQEMRDSSVFSNLGRIRLYQGDKKGALDLWEQAHALNPDDETIARDLETIGSVVEQ